MITSKPARKCSPATRLAFSLAASQTDASVPDCLLAYAFGWAENMMQAAIKSAPWARVPGSAYWSGWANDIPVAVEAAIRPPDNERQAFSPRLAILYSQHERNIHGRSVPDANRNQSMSLHHIANRKGLKSSVMTHFKTNTGQAEVIAFIETTGILVTR